MTSNYNRKHRFGYTSAGRDAIVTAAAPTRWEGCGTAPRQGAAGSRRAALGGWRV